jgi:hypothetical protein
MTNEQLLAVIAELKTQNEALKATKTHGPSCKITEKGGVSFYGIGRFPVTLYKDQWIKLLANAEMVKTFLHDNEAKLSVKPAKKVTLKVAA